MEIAFLLRGEKISVFRALVAKEITLVISWANLEASILAEKFTRTRANSEQRWVVYLNCSSRAKLLAEKSVRVENLHEI